MSIEPITIPMSIEVNDVTIDSTIDAKIEVVEGGDISVQSLTVTENGTTTAPTGKAYSPVIVNVPNSYTNADEGKVVQNGALTSQTSTTKSANGTYDTTTNNQITVSVPASAVDTGTKSISTNGTHDVVGYASAAVNVPNTYTASDEGKVVDSGALVSQTSTTVTTNGTYDTTTNYEVVVNVSGGTPTLITKTITENGTYDAEDDDADGYSEVTVNVQGGSGDTLQATLYRTISGAVSIIGISGGTAGTDQYHSLFASCNLITSLEFTNWGCIPGWFAAYCTGLTYVSMPDAKAVGQACFRDCSNLEEANFPILETTYWGYSQHGDSLFNGCKKLTSVFMPKIKRIGASMFNDCYVLPAFESDQADQVTSNAFYNCRALQTLILRNETMMTLSNVNAFYNTPFRGYNGTYSGHIYVPQALISSYESASNWSTLVASYPGLFTAIEGSSYENARLDGTPIT